MTKINFLTLIKRVRTHGVLRLDSFLWQRKLKILRRIKQDPINKDPILFCDLLVSPSSVKVEALIAAVLRMRGHQAIILLPHCYWLFRQTYKAALSDIQFVFFDDYKKKVDQRIIEIEIEALFCQGMALQDFVGLEIDGFRTGRNALSIVLRELRQGCLDDQNPDHVARLKKALVASRVASLAALAVLQDHQPAHSIFCERGYTPAGEVFDACLLQGVDVVQWFGSPRSDALMFKRYRLDNRDDHPMALSQISWQSVQQTPWSEKDTQTVLNLIAKNYQSGAWYNRQKLQEGKTIFSPEAMRERLQIDPKRKIAVIFAHILYDATFFYGANLFADYQEWLVETVRYAIANPNLTWIIKMHPVNVWRSRIDGKAMEQLEMNALQKAFGSLPDHIKIMLADTEVNTYSLFQLIDYGLTVRGTIGMELPCFGIPVVTAGTGRYSGQGFTIDPPDREAYANSLRGLHEKPKLEMSIRALACRYYHTILQQRPMPMRSFILDFAANSFGLSELSTNVSFLVAPDRSLLHSPDLGRITQWISSSKAIDFFHDDNDVDQNRIKEEHIW